MASSLLTENIVLYNTNAYLSMTRVIRGCYNALMPTYQTSAIVIGRHNFGEADRVMVLLTPHRGVIRAVAKGVRRIKSRLAGHLELFCESDLMLAEGRNLDIVTSARLRRHVSVTADYDRLRLAYLLAEMVNKLGSDGDHPGLFELVQDTLLMLELGEAGALMELWFKLRLLDVLGYRPQLQACMVCQGSQPDAKYAFSPSLGGIVHVSCAGADAHPMVPVGIKFWRVLLGHPLDVAQRIDGAGQLAAGTLPACDAFYDHLFGRRFRSSEVLP